MPMHVDWCLWNFSLFSALAGIRFIWVRQQDPISRARLQVDTGRLLSRVPLGWWICLVGNPRGRKPSRFASCERVWCHDYQGHSFRPPSASQSWKVALKSQGTYQAYNQDYSQNVSVSAWTWLHMIAYDCTFSSLAGSAPELQYIEISRLYGHYFAFISVLVPWVPCQCQVLSTAGCFLGSFDTVWYSQDISQTPAKDPSSLLPSGLLRFSCHVLAKMLQECLNTFNS